MKISRTQLRKLVREALLLEQDDVIENIKDFIVDDILDSADAMSIEDVIEQGEGAGFESEEIEEALEELVADGIIVDKDGEVSLQ